MTIDKAKLKQLLSAQVSLHKVAKETETIEDENVYLNADDALNEYLDDRGIYIEDVALALITEIDQLKAENEALRKDAQRYRWLRQASATDGEYTHGVCIDLWENGCGFEVTLEEADAAVDTAMAKEASHG